MKGFRAWSRRLHWTVLVAVVSVISVALLGMAEAAIRIRQSFRYAGFNRIEDTYTIDPASGLRIPLPGGVFGPIHINSLGFRGPEFPVPKPPSTVRIAFLGSSTTYCAEVSSYDEAWPFLVTETVRLKWPGVNVDHVNAGVPGYTVSSSLRNLRARVAPHGPDVIVIYEGHNDLTKNALELAVRQGVVSGPTEQNMSWPARYSLLWYLVEKNLLIMSLERRAAHPEGKLRIEGDELVPPFRRDLQALVLASQEIADLVVLVTFSTQLRRNQSPEQQLKAAQSSLYYMPYFSLQDMLSSYETYNDTVRAVAKETGALLVTGEDVIPGNHEHFVDTVHFTDDGSHVMGERVGRALIESSILGQVVKDRIGTSR